MSTTGTSSFNLDVNDLIEEAFERCGKELRTGYDFKTFWQLGYAVPVAHPASLRWFKSLKQF